MNFKQSLIVAFACMAVTVTANSFALHHRASDMGLLNFMTRSNDLLQRDPTRSLGCFDYYLPLINELAVKYETNINDCMDASSIGRIVAEEATLEQRNDLANRSETSCASINQCSANESVEGVFECFINGGSENVKTMYGINADASDGLADLKEQYRLVQNTEYRCTNETKRAYEKDSAEAYQNLNNCILGISDVPTEAPETEAPETEAPETEAPETEAPETEAPETEAPETEAPETEAPETEAPETEAPETEAPETEAPETEAPETEAPETEAPETKAPQSEEDDAFPEEDISALRAFKNLKTRLQKRYRA